MIHVKGIVFDKSGIPRASAQICDGVDGPSSDSVRTDRRGRFVLDNVKPDKRNWLVYSHATGMMGLFTIPDDYAGDSLRVILDYNEAQVEGLVLDTDGRPQPHRVVEILLGTHRDQQLVLGSLVTQEDGRYYTHLPSKKGVKLQAHLLPRNANEPRLQTSEIILSDTDLFVEFPPIAPPGIDVEKALQNRIVVSGVIVDEADKPIPAVRVEVMYYLDRFMRRETITNATGRWQLPLPGQASNVNIRLLHTEFISYHFERMGKIKPSLAELKTGQYKLVMKRGVSIRGIIRNQQEDAIENALVAAGRLYYFYEDGIGEDSTTARSAKDGSFSISGLPADKVDLTIFADGFPPKIVNVDMKKQAGPVDVTLSPGRIYRGQVVDSGDKPVEGVSISHCRWESGVNMKVLSLKATTDANGFFEIPGVPDEGTVRFIFGKRNSALQLIDKQMPEDLSKIDRVVMFKSPVFAGKVLDAETNQPVKNIELTSGRKDAQNGDKIHWYYHYDSREVTSTDGSFRVEWEGFVAQYPFEGGAYLKIESSGYMPAILGPVNLGDEQKPNVIRLVKAEPLADVVIDDNDNPVSDAQLALVCPGERAYVKNGKFNFEDAMDQPENTATTDTQGRFEFIPVDKQGIILVVAPAGWAQLDSNSFTNGSRIRLSRWSRIEAAIHPTLVSRTPVKVCVYQTHYNYDVKKPGFFWSFEEISITPQRVVFDYLPAVSVAIGRIVRGMLSDVEIIEVETGKTYNVTIGQTGRIVKGKILLDDVCKPADFSFTDDERCLAAAWQIEPKDVSCGAVEKADEFSWFYRDTGKPCEVSMTRQKKFIPQIDKEGNFAFDYLPPGRYEFVVNIRDPLPPHTCGRGSLSAVANAEFTVPGGNDQKPIVIPDLKIRLVEIGRPTK
jgi:uncharacterized GH25 family protein